MGVCGSGKTTIAAALSKRLGWPFLDADDFHRPENIKKMAAGEPLDNADRLEWIRAIAAAATTQSEQAMILACSALNPEVRDWLQQETGRNIRYCLLQVSEDVAQARVGQRAEHFMPASLVRSQFDALDPPADAWLVDASQPVETTLNDIQTRLGLQTAC